MNSRKPYLFAALLLLAGALWATLGAMPPVDQKTACVQCHGDFSELLALPNRHAPLEQGKCSECHNPHAARHAKLLGDSESALCARCHSESAVWKTQSNVHPPVEEGKCVACHNPHASKQDHLLKQSQKEVCASCHAVVSDWSRRTHQHSPARQGNCDRCHSPHAGDGKDLLKADQATLCLGCHQTSPAFLTAHKRFDPTHARCSACHDPHASNDDKFLAANLHMPFDEGDCNACHISTAGGGGAFPLKSPTLQTCAGCHDEQAATVQRFAAHGASDARACEMCHNPHASDQNSLLLGSQRQMCTGCHSDVRVAKNGLTDPHTGASCTSCHAVHGSENANYLRESTLKLCAQCHSAQHHVSHPMGEKATDPLTGKPLDCASCHKLHGAEFEKLLHADGARDLCVRCHDK